MTAESKDFSSSMIASASYDSDSGELTVQMRNGREYTVPNFAAQEWDAFQSAWSPGRFWHQHIKGRD